MAYQRTPQMQARLAENRQRIVEAARALIATGGFREAAIVAVAERAGLSTGAIYRYFPSKAELCVEVLTDAVRREIAVLRRAIARHATARDGLRAAVTTFCRRALRGPHLAYAFIAEPAEPEVDAARILCRREFGDVFREVLERGIEAGEFPPQRADYAAACIVGAFTEALVRPVATAEASEGDDDGLIDAIVDFCERAVS